MPEKVVVIGIDGMYAELLNNIVSRGLMPNLGSIMRKNKRYPMKLKSTIPPSSGPAWTSILSGVYPNVHGVYDFRTIYMGNEGRLVRKITTSADVYAPRIPELLSMNKIGAVTINLPFFYPFKYSYLKKEYSIIVTGWESPVNTIFPIELARKYREYLVSPKPDWALKTNINEYFYTLRKDLEQRLNLFNDLVESHNWSLYFIVFSESDWVMHSSVDIHKGKLNSNVAGIFSLIDSFIGRARKHSDNIIIVSDHGFHLYRSVLHFNNYLLNKGLLKVKYEVVTSKKRKASLITKVSKLFLHGKLYSVRKFFRRIFRGKYRSVVEPDLENSIISMPLSYCIYVNRKRANDFRSLINDIYGELREHVDIYEYSEIYSEPSHPTLPPDYFIVSKRSYVSNLFFAGNYIEEKETPNHNLYGIFIMETTNSDLENYIFEYRKYIETIDIVPFIYRILGIKVPKYIGCRYLGKLFSEKELDSTNYIEKYRLFKKLRKITLPK